MGHSRGRADRVAGALAGDTAAAADPEVRARLGEIATELLAVKFTGYRILTAIRGELQSQWKATAHWHGNRDGGHPQRGPG